jgi:hypothetical protein
MSETSSAVTHPSPTWAEPAFWLPTRFAPANTRPEGSSGSSVARNRATGTAAMDILNHRRNLNKIPLVPIYLDFLNL